MSVADCRVRILTLLAQQRPEAIKGMTESQWVDFKSLGQSGPYDLRLESKKFELAKDIAAFANAGGGLIVCGFKATRRPTDLHETVVRQTPFAKRLVNTDTYKSVIAEYVRPSVGVHFTWYADPVDQDLGYLVIEVEALAESDRWALVTKTLNEDGKLAKGGVAIPKRHGDDTQYLPPDEVYQLVNRGLRNGPGMDLALTVESGTAVDVAVADAVTETLVERRRRVLLSSLPQSAQRPSRQREERPLFGSEQRAVEEVLRFQGIAKTTLPYTLSRDLRSVQEYREEVDAYLDRSWPVVLRVLTNAVALQRDPLALRLTNCSDAMLRQVEVIATLDPGYEVIVQIPDAAPDLSSLPWPQPPVPFGKKTLAARMGIPADFPSLGLMAARHGPSTARLPHWKRSQDGLVIKFPPVDLRARADVGLARIGVYGQPSTDGAAILHWTATCTNLDGRQEKTMPIPVERLGVTLPPDAEAPELVIR